MNVKRSIQLLMPLALGIVIALLSPPEGLTIQAMIFMGIFVCAILWLTFEIIDDYIVVILAMSLFVVFNITPLRTVFAPFASSAVWLVIGAFGISVVVAKVGLLKRIAFAVLKLFPENFSGQILALLSTGLVISPLIPSLTAKASVLAPFSATAAVALGYGKSSKPAAGMFAAMWLSSGIFGCAFLSGAVPVFTILGFLPPEQQAEFTWTYWLSATWVWLVILAVLSFFTIIFLFNPGRSNTGVIVEKGFAAKNLAALGPMSRDEKFAAFFLALALLGWMTGKWHRIDSGIWALVIMSLMATTGLMKRGDFGTKISWSTVFFIGGVFSLASMISVLKIDKWLATLLGPIMEPVFGNAFVLVPVLCVITYLVRCVVISQTATTAIFFASLGGLAQSSGVHAWVILFVCYMSTLVWHFSFTNTTYVAALGATGGEMVTHRDNQPMNIAYMIINIIACMVSIPLWSAMGLL
ncbi:MAG: anion permease [Desulfovibrio sp.]|jgi:DASS family divalent anion:Na+ symporter|nr:anion permease [Desulfovibrio sp.]